MEQPYESNPECRYKSQVPIERNERRFLLFWKLIFMVPLAIMSLLGWFFLVSLYIDDGFVNFEWDMLLLLVLPMLFGMAVYNLFKKEKFKEIFESEVDNSFGIFFLNWIYFKDKIGRVSPFPFYYKVSRVKKGKRYRVHKLQNKDLLLKIEDVE